MPFFIPLFYRIITVNFLHMSVYLAEFIGTALLLFFGNGIVAGLNLKYSYSNGGGWIVVSIGWGLAVSFGIYAAGQISGAHINPAVSTSLALAGEMDIALLPGYIIAQVLGAFTGAVLCWLQYLPHWGKTEDPAAKLSAFSTAGAIDRKSANLLSEMLGTMILILGLLMIGANEFTEGLNPLVVGGLITLIGMAQGGTTGFAINPARDLGPRIAHYLLPIKGKGSSQWHYAWVPIVGPIIGGAAGATLYFWLYENTINGLGILSLLLMGLGLSYAVYEELKTPA